MKKLIFLSLVILACNLSKADTIANNSYYESLTFDKNKCQLYSLSRLYILENFNKVLSYSEEEDNLTIVINSLEVIQTVKLSIKDNLLLISFIGNIPLDKKTEIEYFNVSSVFNLADFINHN